MGTDALGGDWVGVFMQRKVWRLTADDVADWVERNPTFFRFLRELVPAGGHILELGCGPGRHGIGAALQGFSVRGIDIDPDVVEQATRNAREVAPSAAISFTTGDMLALDALPRPEGGFDAITHGGLMEHFPSAEAIRESIDAQLRLAPLVVFDVPVGTPKNVRLFERDDIFRQVWTPEVWLTHVLAGFAVLSWQQEEHSAPNMTDDLVVALSRG